MEANATLADRLGAAFFAAPEREVVKEPQESTTDRLLDAAIRRFTTAGIKATTMTSIAAEAELSREALYSYFSNKDAVLDAVVHRELRRFIDGLAASIEWNDDVADMMTETFVYCVEFFRERRVIDGLMDRDRTGSPEEIRARAGVVVGLASRTCADYLTDLGGFDAAQAAAIAETLARLVGSTLVAPRGGLDLHEPSVLRDYAARVVPAIVRGC